MPELLSAAKARLASCRDHGDCADAALLQGEYCSAECSALASAIEIAEGPGNQPELPVAEKARKASYVGAPAVFALEIACQTVNKAFGGYGCCVVGSALVRPDWRDVDVRLIMSDADFAALFPNAGLHWEFDPRWLLLTVSISGYLSKATGLPVDFQFQPQTHANERHKGQRNAIGLTIHRTESGEAARG